MSVGAGSAARGELVRGDKDPERPPHLRVVAAAKATASSPLARSSRVAMRPRSATAAQGAHKHVPAAQPPTLHVWKNR